MLSMFIDAETFEGPMFHTSMWRNDVDLTGKRVAIIGTGATSVQIVPEIAEKVAELYVFQRTAAWSPPKSLFDYSERTKVSINSIVQYKLGIFTLYNWDKLYSVSTNSLCFLFLGYIRKVSVCHVCLPMFSFLVFGIDISASIF